jgi:putative nucleotidyltransferase with HDIG domain
LAGFGVTTEDDTAIAALRVAALLHDIGKLAVPEYIIAKPGKLTSEGFAKMKTHTVVGAEIVERMRFPYEVASLVRGHDEKWDGSGYPEWSRG